MRTTERDFRECVSQAQLAADGDSNDAEISALWDAVHVAGELLGVDTSYDWQEEALMLHEPPCEACGDLDPPQTTGHSLVKSYEVGLLMRVHAEDDKHAVEQFRNAYPDVLHVNTVRPASGQRALPEEIERARAKYGTWDEVVIDNDALASRYDDGTWVQAWVDLPDEEE